jgi:substrate import-associated zinc metallohydrolase lipoprotein
MKKILFLFFAISTLFTSCTKDDELGKSLIDTSTPELNDVDEWIRENYTYPFNVEVKYRWDNSEVDNSKILTPPAKADVIPFLDNMKKIWIDPYVNSGGIDFMKRFIPKQMVLIGSHNYNDNGSIVLGQAEGGRKISLFDLNYISFDFSGLKSFEKRKAMEPILRVFKTMHHEFGHILHQTVAYPIEYKKICTEYTSNWKNFSDLDAKRLGFITGYSMLNPDEDFVEMLSVFLMSGNEGWNKIIDDIYVYDKNWNKDLAAADKAKAKIRQKEKMIADYMQQVWKINIYDLQAEIEVILAEIKGE